MKNNIKRYKDIILAILLSMLPILCCIIYCGLQGCTILDIFIPNGQWNDEVIYYKEVAGTIKYGLPKGFFGYNETRAKIGTFSVWSPILNIFWNLYGLIFGWNYLSPVICNIILMTIALFSFAILAKPNKRQMIKLSVLYATCLVITRFVLSGLSEIAVYFFIILCMGLVYSLYRKFQLRNVIILIGVCILLTLMRPYYLLLFTLPGYYLYIEYKKKYISFLISILGIMAETAYFWINKYMCAEYWIPLINTKWISDFFDNGFIFGCKSLIETIGSGFICFVEYIRKIWTSSSMQGYFCLMFLLQFLTVLLIVSKETKKNKSTKWLHIFYLCYCIIMLFACILFFTVGSGSKHFVEFIVMGLIIIGMEGNKKHCIFGAVVMIYLYTVIGEKDTYDWKLPTYSKETAYELIRAKEIMEQKIYITEEESYDNTVIWAISDVVENNINYIPYQSCYALPDGVGITICTDEYICENLYGKLKSKYILTLDNGNIAIECEKKGADLVVEYMGVKVFQIR